MIIGLVKRSFRVTVLWRFNNTLEVSTLNSKTGNVFLKCDCLRWKIPDVLWIFSNSFFICCWQSWASLNSVAQRVKLRCPQSYKCKGRSGRAVGPYHPNPRSGKVLFRNSRTARRKCSGAPSWKNHKRIPVCRVTYWNSYGRMCSEEMVVNSASQTWCKKVASR